MVNAQSEGNQTWSVKSAYTGKELYKIDVTVTPHIVVSGLEAEYTIVVGQTKEIRLTFSDNEGINRKQEGKIQGEHNGLQMYGIPNGSGLIISAENTGTYIVTIGGRKTKLQAVAVPTFVDGAVADNGIVKTVTLPVSDRLELPMGNTNAYTYTVEGADNSPELVSVIMVLWW